MKKIILIFVIFIMNIFWVSGCGNEEKLPEGPYDLPDWVSQKAKEEESKENTEIKVDCYFDNTMTTKGFILDESGKKDKNASPEYIKFMRSMRDVLKMYGESSFYTLQEDDNQELDWEKTNLDKAFEQYNTDKFYNEGKLKAGSLYYQEFKNDENIKMIITDLTEVNVSILELSNQLNQTFLSKPGYGVYMLAFHFPYNGYGYYTKGTKVVQKQISLGNEEIKEGKPLYVIVVGKSNQLKEFMKEYSKKLKQQGMKLKEQGVREGDDYNCYYEISYIPADIVESVNPEDIVTQLGVGESNGQIKKPEWQNNDWNVDLSAKKLEEYQINKLLNVNKHINLFAYEMEESKNYDDPYRLLINYFIPLSLEEGDIDSISVIAMTEPKTSPNEKIQAIYDQWDCMKYSYLALKENGTEETEEDVEWRDLTPMQFNQEIKINTSIIKKGESITNLVETDQTLEDIKEQKKELKVADTNYLKVQVEGVEKPAELSGETVIFDIPIYLYAERKLEMPEWVKDFSTEKENDNTNTKNLELFCEDLFRLDLGEETELYIAENYKKLTDIVTVITTQSIENFDE